MRRPTKPLLTDRLGTEMRRLLRPSAKHFGFAISEMLLAWRDIVGPSLARRALPEKLSKAPDGAVLTVRARGPAALEIQHDAPRILERLNSFLGGAYIARIRIVQSDLPLMADTARRPRKVLDAAGEAALSERLQGVEHPALKAALGRLGRSVLGKPDRRS